MKYVNLARLATPEQSQPLVGKFKPCLFAAVKREPPRISLQVRSRRYVSLRERIHMVDLREHLSWTSAALQEVRMWS